MNKLLMINLTILVFCFFTSLQVNAQENYKGIIPMITTKAEVEKMLGKPNKLGFYEFDEENVTIRYYENICKDKNDCFCNGHIDTVQYINIIPFGLNFVDLSLDLKDYEKTESSSGPKRTSYANFKIGLVYTICDEQVCDIDYYASEETCKMVSERTNTKLH
jgi:hypothetical protein